MTHVYLANRTPFQFAGHIRVNCDPVPPHRLGIVKHDGQTISYYVGRVTGLASRGVDFLAYLKPHSEIKLDLTQSVDAHNENSASAQPLPDDSWTGGPLTINGAPFAMPRVRVDGAGLRLVFLMRLQATILVKLFVHWIPTQPWCNARIMFGNSSSKTTLIQEQFGPMELRWGDAQVMIPGLNPNPDGSCTITNGSDIFADGQGRGLPVLFYWARHLPADSVLAMETIEAVANLGISGIGSDVLWPGLGNPYVAFDIDPQTWRDARLEESVRRLHTFRPALLGPNRRSMDTGAQEDQVFRGGECFIGNGTGAETITWLADLKRWARPCHHYESDGSIVDPANHPDLAYWHSRPYLHTRDWLGKDRGLGENETQGWYGADDEHFLINRLAAGVRLIDCDLLQEELTHQAMIYLGLYRVEPWRLPYLSIPFAPRSTCWEGLLVFHCWHNLADRQLAQRVILRARDRIQQVIVPAYESIAGDVWDWRRDDRLGPGLRWMPWQQACGAFGLDLMSELVNVHDGRKVAYRAAQAVMRDACVKVGGQWTFREVVAFDGADVGMGAYDWFGCPMAPATVLRHDLSDQKARSVWAQYMQQATEANDFAWLCPGMGNLLSLPQRGLSRNVARKVVANA